MQIASLKLLSVNLYTKCRLVNSGADAGFFLGGDAPQRNGVTAGFFFKNTSCIRKPLVISGGGGVHPLHPPPRSAPATSLPSIA